LRQYFWIHLQERPPVVRREAESEQVVRTRPTPFAVRKGAAIPEQAFEIEHPLADVAVTCLMHAEHAVHTRDGTAGSHRVAKDLPDVCLSLLPVRGQSLAQDLLDDDHVRGVRLSCAVRAAHGPTPRPQAGHSLTSQRVWHGLRTLYMQPISVVQCPWIMPQTPHLSPLLSHQRIHRFHDLLLRPRPVIKLPVWPKQGEGRLDPLQGRCRLHRLAKGALRLPPRCPRPPGGRPRIDATPLGPRDLLIRLRGRVQPLFRPGPPPADEPLHLPLGMKHIEAEKPTWTGSTGLCPRSVAVAACASFSNFTPRARPVPTSQTIRSTPGHFCNSAHQVSPVRSGPRCPATHTMLWGSTATNTGARCKKISSRHSVTTYA